MLKSLKLWCCEGSAEERDRAQRKKEDEKAAFVALGDEVLPGVFDDGQGNAFITTSGGNHHHWSQIEVHVAPLIARKRAWVQKFPAKKVTAMSTVTIGGQFETFPRGILIHYEQK